ncbi:hypothetical protein ACQ4PT_064624 [Festuca glaucescens]
MDLGGGELRVGDEMRDLQQEDAADLDLMPMPPSRGCEQEHVDDYGRRPSTSVSRWGRGRGSRVARPAAAVAQSNRRPLAIHVAVAAAAQSDPENTVGVMTMASTDVRVLVTPTIDLGMILACIHGKLRIKASIPPIPPSLEWLIPRASVELVYIEV